MIYTDNSSTTTVPGGGVLTTSSSTTTYASEYMNAPVPCTCCRNKVPEPGSDKCLICQHAGCGEEVKCLDNLLVEALIEDPKERRKFWSAMKALAAETIRKLAEAWSTAKPLPQDSSAANYQTWVYTDTSTVQPYTVGTWSSTSTAAV